MKKADEIKSYNDTLLLGNYVPYQNEREYYLECENDIVKHYLKPENGQNSIDVYDDILEDFCNKIERALNSGKIHFASYDGKNLVVKYKIGGTFYKDCFTLTESAQENARLMCFLNELPNMQPNYNELLREEKYIGTLYKTYYCHEPLCFEDQESLDEFEEFCKSKLAILIKNKYGTYAGIEKKLSGYFPNLLTLFLIDGILIACGTWYPFELPWQIATKMGFLFAKEFITPEVFKGISRIQAGSQIRRAIHTNQEKLNEMVLDNSLEETIDYETGKDEITLEIEEYICKVENAKYEGYEDHLAILKRLLELYRKTKEISGSYLLAREQYDELFESLSNIEGEVNRCLGVQISTTTEEVVMLPDTFAHPISKSSLPNFGGPKSLKLKYRKKNN